jgi:hypothetical protein
MASGALPKRVTCPVCGAPQGYPCVDPLTRKGVKAHPARQHAAERWYDTVSPDGLTPRRRDEMVETLKPLGRQGVGAAMKAITTAQDPERYFTDLIGEGLPRR